MWMENCHFLARYKNKLLLMANSSYVFWSLAELATLADMSITNSFASIMTARVFETFDVFKDYLPFRLPNMASLTPTLVSHTILTVQEKIHNVQDAINWFLTAEDSDMQLDLEVMHTLQRVSSFAVFFILNFVQWS